MRIPQSVEQHRHSAFVSKLPDGLDEEGPAFVVAFDPERRCQRFDCLTGKIPERAQHVFAVGTSEILDECSHFVLEVNRHDVCLANVPNEPRAAVTGSHKPVGRVASIWRLDSPSTLVVTANRSCVLEPWDHSQERRSATMGPRWTHWLSLGS
jgi:hypothetical protein